jgi:hypothetical protein
VTAKSIVGGFALPGLDGYSAFSSSSCWLSSQRRSASGAQAPVGVGMGAGIGLLQGRAIRGVLGRSAPWFWSNVVGLGAPFLAADIAEGVGRGFAYSLYVSIGFGGLIVGAWQAIMLRNRIHNPGWWVVGSVLGWMIASGVAAAADSLSRSQTIRGLWGAVAYLGMVAGGGLVLGLVTGLLLAWLLPHEPAV